MLEIWADIVNTPDIAKPVALFVVLGIPVIAFCWYKRGKHRDECKLKHSMIERGMSVEEIERVLRAKPTRQMNEASSRHSGEDEPDRAVARNLETQI